MIKSGTLPQSSLPRLKRMTTTIEALTGSRAKTIQVVLIDDHAMLRDSFASYLDMEADIEVVAVASDAEAGSQYAIKLQPDVVLMDIDMPGLSCFEGARRIRSQSPKSGILFLSAHTHDRYIEQALAVEARGYLTKNETTSTVVEAIRTVAQGGIHFSQEVRARIVIEGHGANLGESGKATCRSKLTERELEVLRYIARGLTKKEMAAIMYLSIKTVENHVNRIMNKLRIHDRVELTLYAIREGLAEP